MSTAATVLPFHIPPVNSKIIKGRYLVSNRLGGWAFLGRDEFVKLSSLRVEPGSESYKILRSYGLIVDETNIRQVIQGYRTLNANLFQDTALHIAVITTRCNLRCDYCQAAGWAVERFNQAGRQECGCLAAKGHGTEHDPGKDMTPQVALRVIKYLFDVRNPSVTLEFQGGEPLLNWTLLSYMVQKVREFNTVGKKITITVVSNLMLLDEEKMKFCADHDVEVCTSFDGPQDIHDANRVDTAGRGSYALVKEKVRLYREKFGRHIGCLPTITRASLAHPRRIIDEYLELGQRQIALRAVNNMGSARCGWSQLGFSAGDFLDFYRAAMDYLIELNLQGTRISERMAVMILQKVVQRRDPMFVDFSNPCGAGRNCITYMPDGGVFPCDESRMVGGDLFRLGDILKDDYQDCMKSETLMNLLQASCTDLWKNASVYSPWSGYCPVVNYASEKNIVPKAAVSPGQKIQDGQFDYVFETLAEGGAKAQVLLSWIQGEKR